ncbi:uncharacterized protein LAESUDRAFT_728153 [Laetiporus sulphureus 93-53]|uniref:Integral membrane protein n=1 Tax=Laetiporus sulphureus 93-53 TaxID=1314785 RepID=A0A165D8G3_9APHY|nr:uncharacterized protein LAESUDRAFT_728153 [Laetiporus sulphureus 93-53]KZT04329.1 hypothetical protein LAESUDRAFT_728153 [Laetiporus sulphureus 93-53]
MALIDLNPTMGAVFVGLLLGAVFHGITTLQTIFYYTTYPNDKVILKLLPITRRIMIFRYRFLDSLSLAMVAYGLYKYLITDFLDPLALMYMECLKAEPIVSGIIAFIVHEFLIYRIWMLNRRLVIYAVFLAAFSLLPLSLAFRGAGSPVTTYTSLQQWVAITADTTTSALDLIIACTICLQLFRSRTGFARRDAECCSSRTDKIIQRLTRIFALTCWIDSTFPASLNSRQSVSKTATNSSDGLSHTAPIEFKVGRPTLPTVESGGSLIDDQAEEMDFASTKDAGPDARAYGISTQIIP